MIVEADASVDYVHFLMGGRTAALLVSGNDSVTISAISQVNGASGMRMLA